MKLLTWMEHLCPSPLLSDDPRDRPSPAPVVDVRESAPGEEPTNCDVSEDPWITQELNKIPRPPRLGEEDSTHAPESMEKNLGAQVETRGSDAAQTSVRCPGITVSIRLVTLGSYRM